MRNNVDTAAQTSAQNEPMYDTRCQRISALTSVEPIHTDTRIGKAFLPNPGPGQCRMNHDLVR